MRLIVDRIDEVMDSDTAYVIRGSIHCRALTIHLALALTPPPTPESSVPLFSSRITSAHKIS